MNSSEMMSEFSVRCSASGAEACLSVQEHSVQLVHLKHYQSSFRILHNYTFRVHIMQYIFHL